MMIENAVVLVTDADRGIGLAPLAAPCWPVARDDSAVPGYLPQSA